MHARIHTNETLLSLLQIHQREEPVQKKVCAPQSFASSSSSSATNSNAAFFVAAAPPNPDVYAIAMHTDYSPDLQAYIKSLNGKKTINSQLSEALRSQLDEDSKLCSGISETIPNIPVMVYGHLYSLEEIEDLLAKNKPEPVTGLPFARAHIASAYPINNEINTQIKNAPAVVFGAK